MDTTDNLLTLTAILAGEIWVLWTFEHIGRLVEDRRRAWKRRGGL